MTEVKAKGRITTFYSYKGGTGRSMALANVAWILASNGMRVLVIDWDLEGPGLHRYFHPFLRDKDLANTQGLIDFVIDFESATKTPQNDGKPPAADWFKPYANLLRYAVSLDSDVFPVPGTLDFVPAGRQDAGYAVRVNSFNWREFYEKLGGGVLLEAVKDRLRQDYDYILIDSRTGVSDTSGICTVQMPDDLVVCFTLNSQSIEGAAAAAKSALAQRYTRDGQSTLQVWPVPTRVEMAERDKLEIARDIAHQSFDSLLTHFSAEEREDYWGRVEVLYEPFYAYEEVLSTFRDRPSQTKSMLASMEAITDYLTGGKVARLRRIAEGKRTALLTGYLRQSRRIEAPRAATLMNLAETLRSQGDLGGAQKALEEAINLLTDQLGPNHPETLPARDRLGSLLLAQHEYKAAQKIYEELLLAYRKVFGPKHPDTITCMNNLSVILLALGDLPEAQKLQEEALRLYESVLGPEHPGVATSMNNLASSYTRQGKFTEAELLFRRSLAIQETTYGSDHPEVARALSNLAFLYEKSGPPHEAIALHQRALAIRMKALGPDHPDVAHSISGLARVEESIGKHEKARELHQRALAIREKVLGPAHPEVALSLSSLADIEKDIGNLKEAERLHRRALAIREKAFGPDLPEVALSLSSLADIERAKGNLKEAERLHQRALAIREKQLGPDHPDVAFSLSSLAVFAEDIGDYEEAERLHSRALTIRTKAFGLDHPYTQLSLSDVAKNRLERLRIFNEKRKPRDKRTRKK